MLLPGCNYGASSMSRIQQERNAAIIRARKSGKGYAEVAKDFGISRDRARQIVELNRRGEKRRAELIAKYGARPNVSKLPDDTPIAVLELCDGDMHGWAARVGHLMYSYENPIRTLGDLRRTSDVLLRKEPNVGKKMVAELRRFCPVHDEQTRVGIGSGETAAALKHISCALHAIDDLSSRSNVDADSMKVARKELQRAMALLGGTGSRRGSEDTEGI
jgi:hypothetical protein